MWRYVAGAHNLEVRLALEGRQLLEGSAFDDFLLEAESCALLILSTFEALGILVQQGRSLVFHLCGLQNAPASVSF